VLGGTTLLPSTTDGLVTGGLRNTVNNANFAGAGDRHGILTDPQFRVVLHALEQRDGRIF